ncbi:MAG: efflux RND transporter periplasmic adaptor subunit [Candidatus Marinimicrobia bacterium]|nr:efflux RND transporter periplasmic adaptor subunit [Candidatus Neomarinimicrobiota bacterium]
MKQLITIFGIIWGLMLVGCSRQDHNLTKQNTNENEMPFIAITQWTDKMELFMEYSVLAKSTPGKFIIHLTVMQDFEPVHEGTVTLTFRYQNGETFQEKRDYLLREGIFNPIVELPLAGEYGFTVEYNGPQVTETFRIDDFVVYESIHDIPKEMESSNEGIAFLKEQQWKIEFHTELAEVRPIRKLVQAVGEVLPSQSLYAEITSPVDGILRIDSNETMVIPGSIVITGQVLATLSPPLGAVNSWTNRKLDYEYAKMEYERAQRLKEKKAISNREFEGIKHNFLVQKAGYESHTQSGDSDLFQLQAPISGVVTEITVLPGQKVTTGQKLMTIIDPSIVWLRADVFEKDYYQMDTPNGASLTVPGLESAIKVEGENFRLLSLGITLDSDSRTIPVLLEIANPDHLLKIGQTVQVDLYSTEKTLSLSIPKSAIFDDDANQVVFVHMEGESFEKRVVKTGNRDNGLVAILSGIRKGERVVTKGGYLVKLASTSAAVGHPHAH